MISQLSAKNCAPVRLGQQKTDRVLYTSVLQNPTPLQFGSRTKSKKYRAPLTILAALGGLGGLLTLGTVQVQNHREQVAQEKRAWDAAAVQGYQCERRNEALNGDSYLQALQSLASQKTVKMTPQQDGTVKVNINGRDYTLESQGSWMSLATKTVEGDNYIIEYDTGRIEVAFPPHGSIKVQWQNPGSDCDFYPDLKKRVYLAEPNRVDTVAQFLQRLVTATRKLTPNDKTGKTVKLEP